MALHKMVDGKKVECTPEEEAQIRAEWDENDRQQAANEWLVNRRRDYPSVERQLEMLWDAMKAGEIPKAGLFYNTISAIKEKYKKP